MAEILGLTLSHHPMLRMKPWHMTNVLRGLLTRGWNDKPHLKDPSNWPEPMRQEWGTDQGEITGALAQERQYKEQLPKLWTALDEFNPDFILMLYRDIGETWKPPDRPKYWLHVQDTIQARFYQIFGVRDNFFEEDPEKVCTVAIHTEGAEHLGKHLEARGLGPTYCRQVPDTMPLGLGHNGIAGTFHLDWNRQQFATPIIPLGIDPYGYNRERKPEGLAPWDRTAPPPLTPQEAFNLGQEIARAYSDSPWRVAIAVPTNWSSAQNTSWERGVMAPFIDADLKRFEQWKNNQFDCWGDDWTHEEMEEYAQWECMLSIVLAGAMAEIGAKVKYADLQTTWVCNSNWPTTVFEAR